jgi:hypothetical protein
MDPTSFFKKKELSEKAVNNYTGRRQYAPFALPKDNEEAFLMFAVYLLRNASEEIKTNMSVDLDKAWQETPATDIAEWDLFGDRDRGEVASEIEQLKEAYPSPFCEREAYYATLRIQKVKQIDPRVEPTLSMDKGREIKHYTYLKDNEGKEILLPEHPNLRKHGWMKDMYNIFPQVCVFEHEWFKVDEKQKYKTIVGGDGQPVKVPIEAEKEQGYKFVGFGTSINADLRLKIISEVKEAYKFHKGEMEAEGEKGEPDRTYVVLIGQEKTQSDNKKTGKDKKVYYNLDIDDIYFTFNLQ